MKKSYSFPILIPIMAFAFAAAHLALEHFTGGVRSHHLINNPELPAISNWFELITLPILGMVFGYRIRSYPNTTRWAGIPLNLLFAFLCSLIYGAILAASFIFGAENLTNIVFIGLLISGLLFPVYKIEYVIGFVVGMTPIIGGVLPLIFALFVAVISFVVRYIFIKVAGIFRKDSMKKTKIKE
ncbi:MAG: hypothetical protein K9N09_03835 [Candidatus Cloacimonetes bacterium]|nr:hypothetical protein [Candidatus Cloacimonadota bacterium]MCF7813742.1 hypothetical protein [Candidatus Cloacimonadota bacterium]MCF7867808.1 hypothetical protein [Candidatus Cloacimonadota bacterium]MCF7883214.1 hypothetical protein [Candidatus Cloacimonadota bacterium]